MSAEASDAPRRRTLLVVDDNRLIAAMIRDFFESHDYQVRTAEHGRSALTEIDKLTPDVIICDVLMPEMDGWQLFEEVKRRPELSETPFVFLTVESELPKRLRGWHLGADDYVTKPFEVEELHARVEHILERRIALEQARRGGGALLSGSVEHLAISDLLQILALNARSGILRLERGTESGHAVFIEGHVVHAECSGAVGVKALYRMLGWSDARFRVVPLGDEAVPLTVEGTTTNVLLDGLVSLDDWKRFGPLLPPRDAVVELVPGSRAQLQPPDVRRAEFEVLARAKDGARVDSLLDESVLPDSEIAEATVSLLDRGIIRVRT